MSHKPFTLPRYTPETAPAMQPPLDLLREAGRALAKSTDDVVEGVVFTANPGGSQTFRHTFYLRAPALNDYTYPLFYVWHDANLYPAHVLVAGANQKTDTKEYATDELLHEAVQSLLEAPETRKLVWALIVQVRDEAA